MNLWDGERKRNASGHFVSAASPIFDSCYVDQYLFLDSPALNHIQKDPSLGHTEGRYTHRGPGYPPPADYQSATKRDAARWPDSSHPTRGRGVGQCRADAPPVRHVPDEDDHREPVRQQHLLDPSPGRLG